MKRSTGAAAVALAMTLTLTGCTESGKKTASVSGLSNTAREKLRNYYMMENARVHDTDGFLLDGENSSYDTIHNYN